MNVNEVVEFYEGQVREQTVKLSVLDRRIALFALLRFLVFAVGIVGVYLSWGQTWWVIGFFVLSGIVFIYLVSRHSDLRMRKRHVQALIQINRTELKVLQDNFDDLPEGMEFMDVSHAYAQDIDLFGPGSFYQYSNRSRLPQGRAAYARLLTSNDISKIDEKQAAIRELAGIPVWRQEFAAAASLIQTETDSGSILSWMNKYTPFIPKAMAYVPWIFSGISVILIVLVGFDLVPGITLFYWMLAGLGTSGAYFGKLSQLVRGASRTMEVFQQHAALMAMVEEHGFKSYLLQQAQGRLQGSDGGASVLARRFSGFLSSLDRNGNVFYMILANGFMLRSLSVGLQVERWIDQNRIGVGGWFETMAFFDAYASLGNYAFNNPDHSFPVISKNMQGIDAVKACHPMLRAATCVANDFSIRIGDFQLITGANMAGKSTYLRTVAYMILMANLGLPVRAGSIGYLPIKLITSMRVSDSLKSGESYFFSELKRLKSIVDAVAGEPYFVVLDEILRGTNSRDKTHGSKRFLERLLAMGCTGVIATHDLALCNLAEKYPQVANFSFEGDVIDGELVFDYKLRSGMSQKMNASFLMERMGIV